MTEFAMEICGMSQADMLALERISTHVTPEAERLMSVPSFVTGPRQKARVVFKRTRSFGHTTKFDIADALRRFRTEGCKPFPPDAAFHLLTAPINLRENSVLVDMEPLTDDAGDQVIFYIRENYAGMRYLGVIPITRSTGYVDGMFCLGRTEDT